MSPSGYSSTPLIKKLGIVEGFRIRVIDPPERFFDLLGVLPQDVRVQNDRHGKKDFIHYFTRSALRLTADLGRLKEEIVPNGMIWVSWPKKASHIETDINENMIRDIALAIGLVDVKVCAIDAVWSGLKLVIPVKDRR